MAEKKEKAKSKDKEKKPKKEEKAETKDEKETKETEDKKEDGNSDNKEEKEPSDNIKVYKFFEDPLPKTLNAPSSKCNILKCVLTRRQQSLYLSKINAKIYLCI